MQRHQYRWSCLVRRSWRVRHSVLCRMALRWPGVCRLVLRCRQLPRLCCSRRRRVRVCQLIRGRRLRLVRWFCPVRRRYRRLRRRCLWPVRRCWLRLRGLFPLVVTPEQGCVSALSVNSGIAGVHRLRQSGFRLIERLRQPTHVAVCAARFACGEMASSSRTTANREYGSSRLFTENRGITL